MLPVYIADMRHISGQIFSDDTCSDILRVEIIGKQLYNELVSERMQPASTVNIFAPLKKSHMKTFKSSNKSQLMKVNDKVVELKQNCNLFARFAVIQGTRNIELTVTPHSFFRHDGTLLDGFQGKSKLVVKILEYVSHEPSAYLNADCVVIDAMFLLNQMNPKPATVKIGKDLAAEFLNLIFQISSISSVFNIVFDQYIPNSMKSNTNTKPSLVNLLIRYCKTIIVDRQYIISGNNTTEFSYKQPPLANNHDEADTLIIHCLTSAQLKESDNVLVYANDTDVFTLLLKHYNKLNCTSNFMKCSCGFVNVS